MTGSKWGAVSLSVLRRAGQPARRAGGSSVRKALNPRRQEVPGSWGPHKSSAEKNALRNAWAHPREAGTRCNDGRKAPVHHGCMGSNPMTPLEKFVTLGIMSVAQLLQLGADSNHACSIVWGE